MANMGHKCERLMKARWSHCETKGSAANVSFPRQWMRRVIDLGKALITETGVGLFTVGFALMAYAENLPII